MSLLTGAVAPLADCCHHGWGGPWFIFIWIALIVFVVWLVRRGGWRGPRGPYRHQQTAAELLDHRFARGEIDDDEYRRRRSVLGDEKTK
jgi:putative membrane protein